MAPFVPVHVVSALEGSGLDALAAYLGPGQTSVLLGSSGVGKSTLVNRILGEERQEVREIRSHDDRGRHTTTSRQLLFLPGRRNAHRHPGHARAAAVGRGRGARADVPGRGRGGDRAGSPTAGITPEHRAAAFRRPSRVERFRPSAWRAGSKLGRELTFLDRKQDKKMQREQEKRRKAKALADRKRYDPEMDL